MVRQLRGVARTSSTQLDTTRTYPQVRQLNDMSNPLGLSFGVPPRKAQNPSQSPEMATNNYQLVLNLLCCSKSSRWWQPPKETRNPQPQRSPSATRWNHSSKCTWNHSQSHYDDESIVEMNRRCLPSSQGCITGENVEESEPKPCPSIYRAPMTQVAIGHSLT